jgi:hypothetical protein
MAPVKNGTARFQGQQRFVSLIPFHPTAPSGGHDYGGDESIRIRQSHTISLSVNFDLMKINHAIGAKCTVYKINFKRCPEPYGSH